jgi:glutathione S-transferase
VIDDDGTVVWESHAILRYLAARYGSGRFWRDDPGERSRSDAWMDWSQTRLQPDFLNGVFWGFYRTPERLRDAGAVAKSLARCTADFRLLDQVLSGRVYLGGEAISLADIPAGTALYRYFELDIERSGAGDAAVRRVARAVGSVVRALLPSDHANATASTSI